MARLTASAAMRLVRSTFADNDLNITSIDSRDYPDETIFIVYVPATDLDSATRLAQQIDRKLTADGFNGFLTIRRAIEPTVGSASPALGVRDERAAVLLELLNTRSRASENQPGISYVPDAAASLAAIKSPRHHIVFGRRGAGKTSLLVEAKRNLAASKNVCIWMNIQTYRHEPSARVFLWFCEILCNALVASFKDNRKTDKAKVDVVYIQGRVQELLGSRGIRVEDVIQLVPYVNALLRKFGDVTGRTLYVFLDDFHYLKRQDQPQILDMIHGCVRDAHAWLKVAAIKSLCRWYQQSPPMGLQTGQDANLIDLDLTLEQPAKAKEFLEKVLSAHISMSGLSGPKRLFAPAALDRLILASGGVPRDYLVLAGEAMRVARARTNAKLAGVQDVNRAAGDKAKVKINELEDDTSGNNHGGSLLKVLDSLREFCITAKECTYFRVDFKDREHCSAAYGSLAELVDVRLVHSIHSSVSHEHEAGERSEVLMLDLSQYSGQRLKKGLRVLDLDNGVIVEKRTGSAEAVRRGAKPNALLAILRRGPLLELATLPALDIQ